MFPDEYLFDALDDADENLAVRDRYTLCVFSPLQCGNPISEYDLSRAVEEKITLSPYLAPRFKSGHGIQVIGDVFFQTIPFVKIAQYVEGDIFIVTTPAARLHYRLDVPGYKIQQDFHASKIGFSALLTTRMPLVEKRLTREALECLL
jgi:hypothetical protein